MIMLSELSKRSNHEVVRHLTFQGMKIAIETDKGEFRHWHDPKTGEHGKTKMHYPYGYFVGTKNLGHAGDGGALDVFVGKEEKAKNVYVVHQMQRPDFKKFDELKVLVGFESEKQARAAYLCHFYDEKFLGKIDTLTVDEFKDKYLGVEKALGSDGILTYADTTAAGHALGVPNPNGGTNPTASMFNAIRNAASTAPDVDSLSGVTQLIGRLRTMKDAELATLVTAIWGPGNQYTNASPELVKCEVLGFLLDQRDLFQAEQEMQSGMLSSADQMSTTSLQDSEVSQPLVPNQ